MRNLALLAIPAWLLFLAGFAFYAVAWQAGRAAELGTSADLTQAGGLCCCLGGLLLVPALWGWRLCCAAPAAAAERSTGQVQAERRRLVIQLAVAAAVSILLLVLPACRQRPAATPAAKDHSQPLEVPPESMSFDECLNALVNCEHRLAGCDQHDCGHVIKWEPEPTGKRLGDHWPCDEEPSHLGGCWKELSAKRHLPPSPVDLWHVDLPDGGRSTPARLDERKAPVAPPPIRVAPVSGHDPVGLL